MKAPVTQELIPFFFGAFVILVPLLIAAALLG